MEEIESRFERILNKLTMFLNQDNRTPLKPNNETYADDHVQKSGK